jgi:Ankyrin repeats (3 copies)
MSSNKRAVASATSPVDDSGILLQVLTFLGPGHHLFISAVSKAWRESYKRVASVQMAAVTEYDYQEAVSKTITSHSTLCSAVFASVSRVRLAHECGLTFGSIICQRIAGRVADVATLRAAHELGLQLCDEVLIGAAEAQAASVPNLQWLHTEQGCSWLPESLCDYAARAGSLDTLRWSRDHGCEFTASACKGAAVGAHVHVLQFVRGEFLRGKGCKWDETACSAAAKHDHLRTLKWLHERGCPWHAARICGDAAASGSIEMLRYLKQQGCEYNTNILYAAAVHGRLAVCQFLVAEQCPYDARACSLAAAAGHLETVRFLHESGCPWKHDTICAEAAESGNIELLQYLKQAGCVFSAYAMRIAAERGDLRMCQYLRAEQCPWDKRACKRAAYNGHVGTLHWLHEQGCPWSSREVFLTAASCGHLPVILYVQSVRPALSAARLLRVLNVAGTSSRLAVAKWARQQGAEWPAVLVDWSRAAVHWARAEGCTSRASRY